MKLERTLERNVELLLRQNQIMLRIFTKHFEEVLNKEDEIMDVVKEVSDQVDVTLAVMSNGLAEIQKDLAALASIPIVPDNTAAIEAQLARLKDGTDKLAAGLPAPVVAPAPAPAPPAPVSSPAPAEAPPAADATVVVPPVPGAAA